MWPVLLRLETFTVYTFSVVLAVAAAVGGGTAGRRLVRSGMTRPTALLTVVVTLLAGLLAARAWWIAEHRGLAALVDASWAGGLVWYGGLIGGTLAATVVFRAAGMRWLAGADAMMPGLLLGLVIGRVGCHLAGDGDWGTVTEVPWGVSYASGVAGWPHPEGVRVHPAPLYESVGSLALLTLLVHPRLAAQRPGHAFWLYCIGAGLLRLLVEGVRVNPVVGWGLTEAQLASVALIAIGVVGLRAKNLWARPTPTAA